MRILLVDDHPLVRRGLAKMLGDEEINICGEAADGKEAIEKCLALSPDVILMDVSMPIMTGIEATRQIRRLSPSTKIIILSMHNSPQIEAAAKEAGANAYLTKTMTIEVINKTIRDVLKSEG
jgi:two-component system NarL family response regulator